MSNALKKSCQLLLKRLSFCTQGEPEINGAANGRLHLIFRKHPTRIRDSRTLLPGLAMWIRSRPERSVHLASILVRRDLLLECLVGHLLKKIVTCTRSDRQATVKGTGSFMHGVIPTHGAFQSGGVMPMGFPTQPVVGLIDLKMQQIGFVRSTGITLIEPLSRPVHQDRGNEFAHGSVAIDAGAEIERLTRGLRLNRQCFCQQQVTRQWFNYMLPWAGGRWISHRNRLTFNKGTDGIRHNAIN